MTVNRIARMMTACEAEKDLINMFGLLWMNADQSGRFSDYDDTNITYYDDWMISTWSDNNEISFLDNDSDTCIIFTKTGDKYWDLKFKYTDALPKWMKVEF